MSMLVEHSQEIIAEVGYLWDIPTDILTWYGDVDILLSSNIFFKTGDALNKAIDPKDWRIRMDNLVYVKDNLSEAHHAFKLHLADGRKVWVKERIYPHHITQEGNVISLIAYLNILPIEHSAHDQEIQFNFQQNIEKAFSKIVQRLKQSNGSGSFILIHIQSIDSFSLFTFIPEILLKNIISPCDQCFVIDKQWWLVVLENCTPFQRLYRQQKIHVALKNLEKMTSPFLLHYMVGGDFKNIDGAFNEIQLALQQAKHDINESPVFRQHAQCEKLIDTQTTYQQVKNVGRALQQQEITLAFQPIVDTQFHECDYYECLARWITKEGSLIGAAQFIPIAEQYGLISLLDQLLLQNALKELLLVPSLKLSVNVSAITASEGDWIKILENYMKSYSSLHGRIIIELTETAVFKNVEESYRFIYRLREIGCLIAIDDFGAGYMSFAHLRDKMAHIVKIDGRYIKDLSFNPHSLSFIRTIIGLTKPYGIKCVAECVETEEQAKTLALEGVMALQGYHLGKPSLQRLWNP